MNDAELGDTVADVLEKGSVVGWFQGRMEFGPRALGGRSIIGDARNTKMQSVMNLKIKYRESFRPFAPAVLDSDVSDYFDIDKPSPYMLMVAPVRQSRRVAMNAEQDELFGIDKLNVPRSTIPAVTHVDFSARIQTVHKQTNPRFHDLLTKFKKRTDCGVLGQHLLQRARRADRLQSRGRLPVLHENGDGLSRSRELYSQEVRAAAVAGQVQLAGGFKLD